jgi:hypothetical protein
MLNTPVDVTTAFISRTSVAIIERAKESERSDPPATTGSVSGCPSPEFYFSAEPDAAFYSGDVNRILFRLRVRGFVEVQQDRRFDFGRFDRFHTRRRILQPHIVPRFLAGLFFYHSDISIVNATLFSIARRLTPQPGFLQPMSSIR